MKLISKLTIAGVLSLTLPALLATDALARGGKNTGGNNTGGNNTTGSTSSSTKLDKTEASHLTFMREEEKLARDVYLKLAEMYPNQRVFANIATKSEQTHTDTMRDKLLQYNLPDPNPDTNNLPDSLGDFSEGTEWGWYFTEKFGELTKAGANGELDALMVGAFIEELDMNDIAICPAIMVKHGYGEADEEDVLQCGLNYTDERGLINAYSFLIDGSERHLRAYVGQIEAITGKPYEAQYLSQEDVDTLLGR